MRNYYRFNLPFPFSLVLLCMVCCCSPNTSTEEESSLPSLSPSTLVSELHSSYSFTENRGQLGKDHTALYYLQGGESECFLRPDGISYIWHQKKEGDSLESSFQSQRIDLTWEGANPHVSVQGQGPYPDVYHFYTDKTLEGLRNVQHFQEVIYKDLYPHIDLKLYFNQERMKYDLIVHPGGKVEDIQFSYQGQDSLFLDQQGRIQLRNAIGVLQDGKPYSYQVIEGTQEEVSSRFELKNEKVQFSVGNYNPSIPLVIDPEVEWGTYYSLSEYPKNAFKWDHPEDVFTDNDGNVYIVGYVYNSNTDEDPNFPVKREDAFMAKFSSAGAKIWELVYGGDNIDIAYGGSIDPMGNVIMVGETASSSGIAFNGHDNIFNETSPTGEPFNGANWDAFVAKFTNEGKLLWGTYYGGEDAEQEHAWAVDTDDIGNIYVVGYTTSSTGIATPGAYDTHISHTKSLSYYDRFDGFLVKFSPSGVRNWGTYFGGNMMDKLSGVAVSEAGDVYISGSTESENLGYNGYDHSYHSEMDALLAKFNSDGDLNWSTYYGSWGADQGHSVMVDGAFVYLAGNTTSPFGIAINGQDNTYNGKRDAFLVKFDILGDPIWATYFGGEGHDGLESGNLIDAFPNVRLAVGQNSQVYLAGNTRSYTGIAFGDAINSVIDGPTGNPYDGFLASYEPDGSLDWATYFGGESTEGLTGVAMGTSSKVYITGITSSQTGIALNGYQNAIDESLDGFLIKINPYSHVDDIGIEPGDSDEDNNKGGLTLSPNPSSGKVTVSYHGKEKGPFQILVMDKEGKTLYQSKELMAPVEETLYLSKLKTGLYTVVLDAGKFRLSEELILLK